MTSVLLLRSLCDFLKQTVKDYAAAQGEDGRFKEPRVFEWFLPFKNPKAEEKIDFPYIVARVVEGNDQEPDPTSILFSTLRVDLAFGVYSESRKEDGLVHPDGAYDLLNLMEHVRMSLFRQQIINHRYKIEKPYKWSIPEEQPYPLWVGQAQTIWTVQSVIPQHIEGAEWI